MGKADGLRVTMHGNRLVYYPGDNVSGEVSFHLSGAASSLKAVHAKCSGRCHVSQKGGSAEPEATEQYLRLAVVLWKKDSSGALGPGNHTFNFQFSLPTSVPTSFEGRFGRVEYAVQAVLEAAWYRSDQTARLQLYVLNPLDLNLLPECRCSSLAEVHKKVSYSLFKSGTVSLTVSTDLRGYVPGQLIRLSSAINNGTGKSVSGVTATLMQKVTFRGRCVMYDVRTLAQVEGGSVGARQNARWHESIALPPLPQSHLVMCHLIDIEYFVQVAIRSIGLAATLPIVVGNVPVLGSLAPGAAPAGTAPIAPSLTPSAPPLPPPPGVALVYDPSATALPTKLHSQLQDARSFPGYPSPPGSFAGAGAGCSAPGTGAFATAPGPAYGPPSLPAGFGAGGPQLCLAPGETVPFFGNAGNAAGPGPGPSSASHHPLLLPPEFGAAMFPYDPPPSYEESCQAASDDAAQMGASAPDPLGGGRPAEPQAPCE